MRRTIIVAALQLCIIIPGFAQGAQGAFMDNLPYYIENTEMFGLGQEEGRSYYIPESSISLNGRWKFLYAENPQGIPSDFFNPGFNDRKWSAIEVPSNWEMQGYGQAVFRNTRTPFHANPPYVPDDYNPTGAYRTEFTVPSSWKGQEVFLRFEKVASASFVWVNGKQVGYNEGAQEPAEYDITKYIKPGRNSLAVLVLKYSDGYYLECQDYWRLAGIFDDVTLYSTGSLRMRDWQVITDFDSSFTDSDLSLNVAVRSYGPAAECSVKAKVIREGKTVARMDGGRISVPAGGETTAELSAKVASPKKWTAETPDLYNLVMELTDASGKVVETISRNIGFKKTEIRDGVFYLNGQAVKLNGICSHMQHPELGHAMDEATIRKDMEILKQFNFNTVRTSHYPPVNRYLELADEYGLYIVDETGDEAHATEFVCTLPEWEAMYRERARQMVLRDRNHACVLFWSAGNESGEGQNIANVIDEGRKYDPTRYWMYGGNAPKHPAEEIVGPRYPLPFSHELEYGLNSRDKRPSFMDEYVSVAGNGGGAMDEFWREIDAHESHLGGAIWDFVSPGISQPVRLLEDKSPNSVQAAIFGNARLVKGRNGLGLDLNKLDQWVQVYRDDAVEIGGNGLTITMDIFPRANGGDDNYLLTKGSRQYGLVNHVSDKTLEFYIDNGEVVRLTVPVPENWMDNWHNVLANYDGQHMRIFVDGGLKGTQDIRGKSGRIRNLPVAVCIGRDEQKHGQETDSFICDAVVDNVGIFAAALEPGRTDPSQAAMWLDFEKETDGGVFYSYGLGARTYGSIWPDRTPQPEMYQMKKSAQPLKFDLLDARDGTLQVRNRNSFLNASAYRTMWYLNEDGTVIASGEIALDLEPGETGIYTIPFTKPAVNPGKEYRITVSSVLKEDTIWAGKGHELAWEQFELPDWYITPAAAAKPAGNVRIGEGGIVSGDGFTYLFDLENGALKSMVVDGKELLKSPLKLNIWRAPVADEVDGWDGFTTMSGNYSDKRGYAVAGSDQTIASMYYAAHVDDPVFLNDPVKLYQAGGSAYVDVRELAVFGGMTDPDKDNPENYLRSRGLAAFESIYRYRIDADGTISVKHYLNPQGQMPQWLPRIGLTLSLDSGLGNVEWYGRGPQSSYPDRKTGCRMGIYESTVEDMYEPYLIPQDYGLRMDNRWVEFTDGSGRGLHISMDVPFAFNAYPFTTENLTRAEYTFQLRRTGVVTVNLDYDTSGVGETCNGIYQGYRAVPDEVYERTLTIKPLR